jgi:RimJ/RimL family protein N-acetyltransferase
MDAEAVFSLTRRHETERLRLRPLSGDDFDAVRAMQSHPAITQYMFWDPRNETEIRAALEDGVARTTLRREGDWIFIAAELKDTGALVVDLVLKWLSAEHRMAEIGFIAHPDHHGRGFATEAAREVLRIAFEELEMHRVIGQTFADNVASARVMEKLGMRREAHLVENLWVKGGWRSELTFAILDREWRAAASAEGRPGRL